MSERIINLNDRVKVKLTTHGREVVKSKFPDVSVKADKDGFTFWQLWELFSMFGSDMYIGGPNLSFDRNEITVGWEK